MLRNPRSLIRQANAVCVRAPAPPRLLHTTPSAYSAWPTHFSGDADFAEDASAADATTVTSGTQERRSGRLQQTAPIDRTDAGTSRATRHRLEMPPKTNPAKTIVQLQEMKAQGKPIACLTAYDYPSALSLRHSDVDICLVGDSMANVALGHASTQSLTLDATIHHCQAVHRGLFSPILSLSSSTPGAPLLIADVPFGFFQTSTEEGVRSAIRLLKEGGVDGVKIEGGKEIIPLVTQLTSYGIPVMGHIGLQPQRVGSSAGYRLQGRTATEAATILQEAYALQAAGVFSMVLECIPNKVGELISRKLQVPTIGIGAGPQTDGQILVTNDMLATMPAFALPAPQGPKFARNFVNQVIQERAAATTTATKGYGIGALRLAAVEAYVHAVRQRTFPDPDKEGYKMKSDEYRALVEMTG